MPQWLGDLLKDWGAAAGLVTFALGLIGALLKGAWSLFADGAVMSKSRHLSEVSFYETQIKMCNEAADRRIAELRQDVIDLTAERDDWRNRFWRSVEAGQTLARGTTPPGGIHRSEIGQ